MEVIFRGPPLSPGSERPRLGEWCVGPLRCGCPGWVRAVRVGYTCVKQSALGSYHRVNIPCPSVREPSIGAHVFTQSSQMGEGPGSGNPAGRNDQYPLCTFYRSTPHLRRGSLLIMTGVFLGVGLRRRQEGENFFTG